MSSVRKEIYAQVTEKLIEKLSQGTIPWRKSWEVGLPTNLQSKQTYNGINFINLCMNEYPSPYYVTYLQCKERGGYVKKGEKGSWVIYWELKEIPSNNDEVVKRVPFIKRSIVFNLAQTSLYYENDEERKIIQCEEVIKGMELRPNIRHNTLRAYYSQLEDYISLPPVHSFTSEAEYYSTLMHELIHWTGHTSRLNRKSSVSNEELYSFEELIAEIGNAYLCALTGIAPKTLDNQAAYIQGWLKLSESDEDVFMKAAIEAQRAVNFIVTPYTANKSNAA